MDNRRMITYLVDMAALACQAEGMWGVYCSWAPVEDAESIEHIRACLPAEFKTCSLPYDNWFLRFLPSEATARSYYKECLGDDAEIHDGVFAVLISHDGEVRTANT